MQEVFLDKRVIDLIDILNVISIAIKSKPDLLKEELALKDNSKLFCQFESPYREIVIDALSTMLPTNGSAPSRSNLQAYFEFKDSRENLSIEEQVFFDMFSRYLKALLGGYNWLFSVAAAMAALPIVNYSKNCELFWDYRNAYRINWETFSVKVRYHV